MLLMSARPSSCHDGRSTAQLKHQALGQVQLSAVLCSSAMHIDRSFSSAGCQQSRKSCQSPFTVEKVLFSQAGGIGVD